MPSSTLFPEAKILQTTGVAPSSEPDWTSLRSDFPILDQEVNGHPLVYFDNAATSQKPRQVIAALTRYYEHDNANVHRGIHTLSNRSTEAFEAARRRSAGFINAASEAEIIFTRGTTEAINLLANTWGLANIRSGDRIVLTEMEHHSNLVPWQMLAEKTGATLAFVPVQGDEGTLDLDALERLLEGPTKLIAVTHISNTLGVVNPVQEICALAKSRGVISLVDAAQSVGHCPVDVQAMGCDFLAFSGHKICAPTGIGVLYGRAELLDAMPPWQGGGEMIASVDYHSSRWNTVPHKFEAGTPHMEGAIGLHAAMDYLDEIGRDRIFAHDQKLAAYAWQRLSDLPGIRLFGPPTILDENGAAQSARAGLVSFHMEKVHAHDLVTMADQKGLALRGGHHCNQPLMKKLGVRATARASFYFYNTQAEVDRMIEILDEIVQFFDFGS